MATHLIIDGYNLLALAGGAARLGSEEARESLLRDLARYRQRKGHPITIVFDGWQQGSATERREHRAGLEVLYSRRGEKADQVIQRMVDEFGRECAVVSSDREVGDYAKSRGAFVLDSREFVQRLNAAPAYGSPLPYKELDQEDSETRARGEKKGNPRKLPKSLRRRNRDLKRF